MIPQPHGIPTPSPPRRRPPLPLNLRPTLAIIASPTAGTSLVLQWLRLLALNSGDLGLILLELDPECCN